MNSLPGQNNGLDNSAGNILIRWCSDRTTHALSSAATIVSVIPFRKGSVFNNGRVIVR